MLESTMAILRLESAGSSLMCDSPNLQEAACATTGTDVSNDTWLLCLVPSTHNVGYTFLRGLGVLACSHDAEG